ncbi:phage integrase family protein [Synechococcus sp. BIOS-U3-1]|nr:phage integrase family protein [Synechococcus sp. BIOS-U3-1]|tara:strand:+ start:1192 stop:1368 length:177 start_codon:yes stop_codon:yes gene_type:complete
MHQAFMDDYRQAAYKAQRTTAKVLGFDVFLTHSFRCSFITGAVKRGASLPAVQRLAGH